MKLNFILILLIMITTSCILNDYEYHNIPENEKPIYNDGDILIFKSNYGIFDTLKINSRFEGVRSIDKVYNYEYISFFFNKTPGDDTTLLFEEFYERGPTYFVLHFKGFDSTLYINELPEPISITIGEKNYSNVYELTDSSSTIRKIYYTHKYCVIKYETDMGVIWELVDYY